MIEVGSKVHYYSRYSEPENGIVKKMKEDHSAAWVVYKCNGHWDEYQHYTGALTDLTDLREGWHEDPSDDDT